MTEPEGVAVSAARAGRGGARGIGRALARIVLLTAMIAAASPVLAGTGMPPLDPPSPSAGTDWAGEDPAPTGIGRILSKAIVFETLSSTGETALFLAFYGGAGGSGPAVFALTLTTATAIYVGHEWAWDRLIPGAATSDDPQILAAKATTYRAASTARTLLTGGLVGAANAARLAAFTASAAVLDTALYVANDIVFSW